METPPSTTPSVPIKGSTENLTVTDIAAHPPLGKIAEATVNIANVIRGQEPVATVNAPNLNITTPYAESGITAAMSSPGPKKEVPVSAEPKPKSPTRELTEQERQERLQRLGIPIAIEPDATVPQGEAVIELRGIIKGDLVVRANPLDRQVAARLTSKGLTITIPRGPESREKLKVHFERGLLKEAVNRYRQKQAAVAIGVILGSAGLGFGAVHLGVQPEAIVAWVQSLAEGTPQALSSEPVAKAIEVITNTPDIRPTMQDAIEAIVQPSSSTHVVEAGQSLWSILKDRVQETLGNVAGNLDEVVNALKNIQLAITPDGASLRNLVPGQTISMPDPLIIQKVADCLSYQGAITPLTPPDIADLCNNVVQLANPAAGIDAASDPTIRDAAQKVITVLAK